MIARGRWSVEQLPAWGDQRGTLVSLEPGGQLPFPINRVYYLYGTPAGAERGFHAHRTLEQMIITVSGSCTFLLDDGSDREELRLASPDVGLHIQAMVWREMRDFSSDCVLLVIASQRFAESDYIRDYDEFRRCVEAARTQ